MFVESELPPEGLKPDPIDHLPDMPKSTPGLWPDPEHGPWHIRLYWGRVAGRIECVGMEIKSVRNYTDEFDSIAPGWEPEANALTSSTLRRLNVSGVIKATMSTGVGFYDWWASVDDLLRADLLVRAEELAAASAASARTGRPRLYGPEHYREVSLVYSEAYHKGLAPTGAVARAFHVNKSTAAKWVAKSRRLGFLPETTRGVPRAIEVPSEKEE